MPKSIDQQIYALLENVAATLALLQLQLSELSLQIATLQAGVAQILGDLAPAPDFVESFTPITQEPKMVPLAAGQTATFATKPIPSNAQPIPANIVWSSSDTTNAPVSPNSADLSGLSILVAFPSTVAAGISFTLTVSYTNSDGTTAAQSNSFTTVAPPPVDITGFEPIAQTA